MIAEGPENGPVLVLAHGAGAPMDSDFMNEMTSRLSKRGIRVIRFEFPYMAERRTTGKKRPPDRAPRLVAHFNQVLDELGDGPVYIGGKSMGGRMATLVATEREVAGVCVLGYPFHPPGKPENTRLEHLPDVRCPVLICQGERDALGNREQATGYTLPDSVSLVWCPDGDHSLKPRKVSGVSLAENLDLATDAMVRFIGV
ncbi:alpha/beta fold hydrolase [Saccharospirillum alexandrii]|uniref:alpha/beta fold hydrolase n=1 Tax=Saccharospirillum alexandrii TaxID=2448477 RepID=UPI001732D9E9